jgi:HlyD family secretion protein
MYKKRLLIIVCLVAAIALSLFAVKRLKPVEVIAVPREKDVPVQVYGLGTLEAHTVSKIGFKISGTLVKLNADHGDRVKKGEVLALLDLAEQESRIAKAAASVERAKAALLVSRAGEERARASLKHKEKLDQRREGLAKKGYISAEDADEKRVAVEIARAEVKLAEGDVAAAQAALKDSRAQLEIEKVLLSQHTLTAPYDSQIVLRHKELGSVQSANEPLFTLVDTKTLWARVYVDEERAGSLAQGQPAEIRLRSAPGKPFQGRVQRIDIESDRVSEERRLYVSFENPPEEYHLGEQAEAIITVAVLETASAVPGTEIREFDGTTGRIWTVDKGRLDLKRVSFGHRLLDGRYQITEGLPPDCTPLVRVPEGVREGTKAVLREGDAK